MGAVKEREPSREINFFFGLDNCFHGDTITEKVITRLQVLCGKEDDDP